MQSYERHAKVLELLAVERRVFTNQLARMFDVSRETVRRDLLDMEQEGR